MGKLFILNIVINERGVINYNRQFVDNYVTLSVWELVVVYMSSTSHEHKHFTCLSFNLTGTYGGTDSKAPLYNYVEHKQYDN